MLGRPLGIGRPPTGLSQRSIATLVFDQPLVALRQRLHFVGIPIIRYDPAGLRYRLAATARPLGKPIMNGHLDYTDWANDIERLIFHTCLGWTFKTLRVRLYAQLGLPDLIYQAVQLGRL